MDFVILKVNGQDVSNSSHEDAVKCFQSAEEPIIVEVLRRQPGRTVIQIENNAVMTKNENDNRLEDTERRTGNGETESTSLNSTSDDSRWKRNSFKSNTNTLSFVSTAVQTDWAGLTDKDQLVPVSLNPEERTNDSFDDFLTHDIDFEEVTLQKSGSAEKLGLTVCYSSGSGSEDADTEVYISEIIPESLAARDGRLREGDQILRVNGKDVANKEQTENLFAETKNAVTILVSRCLYQDDEYDDRRIYIQDSPPNSPDNIPAYQNSMIEQLIIRQQQQQQLDEGEDDEQEQQQRQQPPPDSNHKDNNEVNVSTVRSAVAAAPPVPCHTSQQCATGLEIGKNSCSSSKSQNSQKTGKSVMSPGQVQGEDRKQWLQDALKECTKSVECMGLPATGPNVTNITAVKLADAYSSHIWSDTEHIYETIPESDNEPIYSSPYEHHRHWIQVNSGQQIRKQCDINQQQQQQPMKPWHSSSKSNSSGEEKDSSSAYNTGESCHSNPLTLELHQVEKDRHKSALVLCPAIAPTTLQKSGCNCPMPVTSLAKQTAKNQSTWKKTHHQHREKDNCTLNVSGNTATLPADTMYTNVANLQQTMMLQQRLFKQALNRKNLITRETSGTRKSKSHGNFQAPNLTQYQFVGSQQVCATTTTGTTTTMTTTTTTSWTPEDKDAVQMEWKVKRRPDGTRYIARRPIRSRVLRNRAIKISEERAGHTTEDDTMSEMKVGRYWTKEERKRQLERARERKQRQQELILVQQQTRLQQGNPDIPIPDHTDDKLVKKTLNIVDLSYKRTTRKKGTVDDFTTVQDILLHGNRVSGTSGGGVSGGGPSSGGVIGSGGGVGGSGGGSAPSGKLIGLLSVTTV